MVISSERHGEDVLDLYGHYQIIKIVKFNMDKCNYSPDKEINMTFPYLFAIYLPITMFAYLGSYHLLYASTVDSKILKRNSFTLEQAA